MKRSIGRIAAYLLICTLLFTVFGCRKTAAQDTVVISEGATQTTAQKASSEDTAILKVTTKDITLPATTPETSATAASMETVKETSKETIKETAKETTKGTSAETTAGLHKPELISEPTAIKDIFPDDVFAAEICALLGKSSVNDTVTQADLDTITSFSSVETSLSSAVGVGYLRNLKSLQFGVTQISSLPAEIENLTSLEHLFIWGCPLASLPPEIGSLESLIELQASDGRITALPHEIANLTSLCYLIVHDNQITSLPSWLGEMPSLQQLTVTGNPITTIPDSITNNKKLNFTN